MVFQSEKQKRGFFAKLKGLKQRYKDEHARVLDEKIKNQQEEMVRTQKELQQKQQAAEIELAKRKQVLAQKQQLIHLKQEKAETERQLRSLTARGKAVALLRKEAGAAGRGIKKAATSKHTKKVIRNIRKEVFG